MISGFDVFVGLLKLLGLMLVGAVIVLPAFSYAIKKGWLD